MTQLEWQSSVLSHFAEPKKTKKGYVTCCPAHADKNPSLLIDFKDTQDGAKASIKCLAGCGWLSIITAAGMQKKDVYFNPNGNGHKPDFKTSKPSKKERAFIDIDFEHPTAVYSYTDENGQEMYQNCRYETDKLGNRLKKKTFRQRHKMADGWAYALNDIRRVPYNFADLITEPNLIIDCEGEKDAESLRTIGIVATSTTKEAFKELHKFCLGKVIIVCEDNDEPGRKKAKEKAEHYWKAGAEVVKIWTFRDMPERSDVTDWIQADPEQHEFFEIQSLLTDIEPYNPLQSITIDFLREVTPRKPLIEIDGRNALPSGNIGGVVAGIGQGKSHYAEIIASCAILPDCEPYSYIDVHLEENERICIMDTEQPEDDCKDILMRAHKRTGQKASHLTENRKEFKKLSVMSVISLDLAERREKLNMVIKRPEYKLIIIDGILDFVNNPNDPVECAPLILWLHSMAAKYDKGIWCILHGNRNDGSGKGKGWLGDIFQRKATCFLMLRKHAIDPKIRIITTEFDNVKFRHADDSDLNIAMQWDTDFGGFRCIPYPEENKDKLTPEKIFKQCFQKAQAVRLKKAALVISYREITGESKATAYREIDKAVDRRILKKEKLFYSLEDDDE